MFWGFFYVRSIAFETMKGRMKEEKSNGEDDENHSDDRLNATTTH